MIEILKNNEVEQAAWRKLLSSSSSASYFQSPECYSFYKELSFLTPFLVAVSEDGDLKALVCGYIIADGGVVKRYMSRRAIVPGGMLVADDCNEKSVGALLFALSDELRGRAIYTEFRNYTDYSSLKSVFDLHGFKYQQHLNFHVSTESEEAVYKRLSSTKRRDVKQSLKEGAVVDTAPTADDLHTYYQILSELYSTRIKTPLFPEAFFESLLKRAEAHFFLIKYQDRVIGGSLCVSLNTDVLYEWFVCGLDGKLKNIYPSTLATWAAIEYAVNNGYRYFDMMGAGKPDEGYGVRDFKARFGGELVEHGRFLKVNQPILYFIGKKAVAFLKKKK